MFEKREVDDFHKRFTDLRNKFVGVAFLEKILLLSHIHDFFFFAGHIHEYVMLQHHMNKW